MDSTFGVELAQRDEKIRELEQIAAGQQEHIRRLENDLNNSALYYQEKEKRLEADIENLRLQLKIANMTLGGAGGAGAVNGVNGVNGVGGVGGVGGATPSPIREGYPPPSIQQQPPQQQQPPPQQQSFYPPSSTPPQQQQSQSFYPPPPTQQQQQPDQQQSQSFYPPPPSSQQQQSQSFFPPTPQQQQQQPDPQRSQSLYPPHQPTAYPPPPQQQQQSQSFYPPPPQQQQSQSFYPPHQPTSYPPPPAQQQQQQFFPPPQPKPKEKGPYPYRTTTLGKRFRNGIQVFLHSLNSKYNVRITRFTSTLEALGGEKQMARFLVERTGQDRIKFRSIGHANKYLRFTSATVMDGAGSGGMDCEFWVVKHGRGSGDKVYSFESARFPGSYMAFQKDGKVGRLAVKNFGVETQFHVRLVPS